MHHILDVFGALDKYTPPPKARLYQPLFCLSASLMYSNLDSYKNRRELQVSKGVLRVRHTMFLLFFRLRKENALRPGERHRYIHIMNIQRALMASTYTFQSTSALKHIFAWREENKRHDMCNGAICCSLHPTANVYHPTFHYLNTFVLAGWWRSLVLLSSGHWVGDRLNPV